LARRLTEQGARFISVTTEYEPFKGWDTHENGHTRLEDMKCQIDGPIAQLILDLEKTGHLDRTMIILASEFSRDMMVEGRPDAKVQEQVKQPDILSDLKFYGMHRHFTDGCSVLMFGGGIKRDSSTAKPPMNDPAKPSKIRYVLTAFTRRFITRWVSHLIHSMKLKNGPFILRPMGKANP
jgi:hypothetical protein